MLPLSPPAEREPSFRVAYQRFGAVGYNLTFSGKGSLTVSADRQRFVFTGKKRGLLPGSEMSVEFKAAEIADVIADGIGITFHTTKLPTGKKRQPFMFFCHDAGEAAEIQALLPTVSTETAEEKYAAQQLRLLPVAKGPIESPTCWLIGINVVWFLFVAVALGAGLMGDNLAVYIRYGANNGAATTHGEWWRLVTSMFLHYGVIHLAFNMWALFQSGRLLEQLLGRSFFTLVYFASGIGGSLASIWWYQDKTWSAGASGAIFGVYGALIVSLMLMRRRREVPPRMFVGVEKSALLFALYNLFNGFAAKGIDNACHLGGFVVGAAIAALLVSPVELAARSRSWLPRLGGGLGFTFALIGVGILVMPRFDYVPREELDWAEFAGTLQKGEGAVLKKFQEAVQNATAGKISLGYFKAQAEEVNAFYREIIARAKQLRLTPGLRTDGRRNDLLGLVDFQMKRIARQQALIGVVLAQIAEINDLQSGAQRLILRLTNLSTEEAANYWETTLLPYFEKARESLPQRLTAMSELVRTPLTGSVDAAKYKSFATQAELDETAAREMEKSLTEQTRKSIASFEANLAYGKAQLADLKARPMVK